MFGLVKRIVTRTNLLTLLIVALLFAVLPLSQKLSEVEDSSVLVVREVDVVPPPPPPPPLQSQSSDAASSSQGGINLESIPTAVRLLPVSLGNDIGIGRGADLGLGGFDLGSSSGVTFNMEGVGFGTEGIDRPPILLVRPTLNSDYMDREGITQFTAELMVKWLKDGSLVFVGIERIDHPDPELAKMVREAIPRMRYSRPTVDGEPVERFIRLPLTITAN